MMPARIAAAGRNALATIAVMLLVRGAPAATIHVSPSGRDAAAGTAEAPLRTFDAARQAARRLAGREPVEVRFADGVYYLPDTVRFTAADSGTSNAPALYAAAPGAEPVLSGGLRLDLRWEPFRDGILKASVPPGPAVDQLFVDGVGQPMARYPDYDASIRPYFGFAADAFSASRAARWSDPAGGFIHAMHRAHWGGYHYRITGKNEKGEVTYEGGWQNNRQMGMHPQHRFVENVFEELDVPGEWFHDAGTSTLYYLPPSGVNPATARFEVVRLRHLVEFAGSRESPVRFVTLRGFVFRHAARTFMETREPLLRSDWTVYRGGAVRFEGAEDCAVADCEFDQLGGNAIFVNNYNRRIRISGCDIHDTGASAVAFVGDSKAVRNPLFEYAQRQDYAAIDRTPGPRSDNYPADCAVEDCLLRRFGVVEKQATGVQISMSMGIAVRHSTICGGSRAGINIGDGTFGGHLVEFCDVFDTVRETGDHGSFNSWGRDRYWGLRNAPPEELPALALLDAVKPVVLRNNRWRCDHGWDVDLDDGSSNYEIYNNLFLNGGLKLREGFHRRVWNNIAVNNTLHPHVWYERSGDVVTNNIWMGAYRPAGGMPKGKWGQEIDRNLFPAEADRAKFAANGCDAHSVVGDPVFVDPARGDYRVKEGSPALKLGFVNFAMDRFGVQKPGLKALAPAPALPEVGVRPPPAAHGAAPAPPLAWQGALVRDLQGEEFSAYGVSRESGGVVLKAVAAGSPLAEAGLKAEDLAQGIDGRAVRSVADLLQAAGRAGDRPLRLTCVRGQEPREAHLGARYAVRSLSGGCTNVVVRNGTLSAPTGNGLDLTAGSSAMNLVEKVRVFGCQNSGLVIESGSLIRECEVYGCGLAGIKGSGAVEVRACRVEGNGTGLELTGGSRAVGNTIVSNSGAGLKLTGSGSYVADNVVRGNGDNYSMEAGNQLNLLLCEIPESIDWPCSVKLVGTLTCLRADTNGIEVAADDVTIDGCTAFANEMIGIYADSGSTIRGCTAVRNIGECGIYVEDNCRVVNNCCHSNRHYSTTKGIYVTGCGNLIDGNNVTANGYGIFITGSSNLVVRNSARGNVDDFGVPAGGAGTIQTSPVGAGAWDDFSY